MPLGVNEQIPNGDQQVVCTIKKILATTELSACLMRGFQGEVASWDAQTEPSHEDACHAFKGFCIERHVSVQVADHLELDLCQSRHHVCLMQYA